MRRSLRLKSPVIMRALQRALEAKHPLVFLYGGTPGGGMVEVVLSAEQLQRRRAAIPWLWSFGHETAAGMGCEVHGNYDQHHSGALVRKA